jgi:tetratricopeptide (TPR) repeat protein
VELAPDSSLAHATRAFVLDWNANPNLFGEDAADYLLEADREATRAVQLDKNNTLALAYYAEILIDQQKWTQAEDYIDQALAQDPTLMDVHRVHAYVLETLGEYNLAIQAYDRAIEITPNMTFLYIQAGANYRTLGFRSPNEDTQKQLFEKSLEYFDKAARINEQLEVKDPTPYLSIARTYSQMGEYFSASRNVRKALEFEPDNADVYGQLGIVFFKSRNYEGSIPALKCAIRGCEEEESCQARFGSSCADAEETGVKVIGQELSASTVVYYYTYGSVLAALSRPQQNYCAEARQIFNEVKTQFGSDTDIAGIIAAGEFICDDLAKGGVSGTPLAGQGTTTPLPELIGTPTPTPGP